LIGPGPANTLGLRPGVIEVANDLGSVVLDQPYTFTKMAPDTPPDPPITIPDIELNEFKESLEAKNTETIQEPEQIAQDNEITKETLYIDKSKDEVLGEILKDDEVILALANDPQEESNITNDEISTTSNEENLQETIIENSQTNTEDVEVVTDQTTINQLSNLVSNNELDIKEFFSLVGKDDEGNEIRALVKADTSTLISPSIVIRSEQGGASTNSLTTTTEEPASLSNETTIVETSTRTAEINIVESTSVSTATTSGVYKYDSGAIEMTSSGRGVFDGGSYRSISTVDFDNKTISTNYTGTLEVGYLAADLEFDVSTGDTSYTSDISQAFNFTLDSDGYHDRDNVLKSNITSLKAGGGLENGVNDFEVAGESTPQEMYNALDNGKFAGFGEFSTPSVGGVGSSSLKIEQANSGKGENFKSFQDSVEILSGSNSSITPIKQ